MLNKKNIIEFIEFSDNDDDYISNTNNNLSNSMNELINDINSDSSSIIYNDYNLKKSNDNQDSDNHDNQDSDNDHKDSDNDDSQDSDNNDNQDSDNNDNQDSDNNESDNHESDNRIFNNINITDIIGIDIKDIKNISDIQKYDDENNIILVQNEKTDINDEEIMNFVNFCVDKRFFDTTFYDYGNAFSVVATKLPMTFEKMTTDGNCILKKKFIKFFNDNNYEGDIDYVYQYIKKKNKNKIYWEELLDFFLPFIKYITF